MPENLFTGELTRLVAPDPDQTGKVFAEWSRDSEFFQLFENDPAVPSDIKQLQQLIRKNAENERAGNFPFLVQRLTDDRIIGSTGLWNALNAHGDAWVSIGIGERELWSKGYGSDALKILLRFAFQELNLHRVSLGTFGYNIRAIRAYEKAGFVHEGRLRKRLKRFGEQWDDVVMGILRSDWSERQNVS